MAFNVELALQAFDLIVVSLSDGAGDGLLLVEHKFSLLFFWAVEEYNGPFPFPKPTGVLNLGVDLEGPGLDDDNDGLLLISKDPKLSYQLK